MPRFISLLLLTVILSSCVRHATSTDVDIVVPEDSLAGKIVASIPLEVASLPENLILTNDELIVSSETSSDKALVVFDTNGEVIKVGIQYGQGPNEVLEITSLHTIGGAPYIYDSRKGIIFRLDIDSTIDIEPVIKDVRMHDDALAIPSYTLVANTASKNSYSLINSLGEVCDSISYFPPAPKGIAEFTHSLASTGHLALNADSMVFVRAIVYDGGVDFFRIKDGKITHENRFEIFPMEYSLWNILC